MYGVLDRIEDNHLAVILIEEVNEEVVIPIEKLPSGSKEGTWFQMEKVKNTFQVQAIDKEKTLQAAQKSMELLSKLRARSQGSQYKRNKND